MIKRARRLAVLILAGMPIAAAAQAPQDSVELNGVVLTLGMAQAEVQGKLGALFEVQQDSKGGEWTVLEKGKSKVARASVTFKSGKLAAIKKYWTGNEPDTEAAFANALYGAISSVQPEDKATCTVQTADSGGRLGEIKSISVVCGHKTLQTDIFRDGQGRESVTISETLSAQQ